MNKQEKDYAMGRIDSIANEKCNAIQEKHTVGGVKFSTTQRLKAFRAGKYKIKADVTEIRTYTDLCDIVDFTEESDDVKDEVKIAAECKKVMAEATRIKDQMMLGDSTGALKMIEQFAK